MSGRGSRDGAALVIVLWCLVAMGFLAASAGLTGRLDLALATSYRDHAAALALAEAGIADALAAFRLNPDRAARTDSLAGRLETGAYRARWDRFGERLRIEATGSSGRSSRMIEAWTAGGEARITDWRERL